MDYLSYCINQAHQRQSTQYCLEGSAPCHLSGLQADWIGSADAHTFKVLI